MAISTAGLTKSIRALLTAIHGETPRARERRIDPGTAADIARQVRATIREAKPDDDRAVVRVYGGFMPNGARFAGDSDYLTIQINLLTGDRSMGGGRAQTTRRPHGRGDLLIGRLLRPSQTMGRIVVRG